MINKESHIFYMSKTTIFSRCIVFWVIILLTGFGNLFATRPVGGDSSKLIFKADSSDIDSALNSMLLLKNKNDLLPLKNIENGSFASVILSENDLFAQRVISYLEMPVIDLLSKSLDCSDIDSGYFESYDKLLIFVDSDTISIENGKLIKSLIKKDNSITVWLGSEEELAQLDILEDASVLLVSNYNHYLAADIAAQIVFGGFNINQKNIENKNVRLSYVSPDYIGIENKRLRARIDSIVFEAIEKEAFPGCQVLMAVGGKVIYKESYGFHTYNNRNRVKDSDLYDLASVTKISGALPLIMQLVGKGDLDLDEPFSNYWRDWRGGLFRRSDKDTVTLRQLLSHRGRLQSYINFWAETKNDGRYNRRFYRHNPQQGYTLELGDHLYLRDNFKKRVYRSIRRSNLSPTDQYRYSCLSFLIYPELIADITGSSFENLLYSNVYSLLGASRVVYNPLQKGFSKYEIPPTEFDSYFRSSLVHGRVHDEAAAVLGGVSGNAGLFANANDMAKLMQMYLNRGEYGGVEIIPRYIVDEFIKVQYPHLENHRGLGFDKPNENNLELSLKDAYPAKGADPKGFGHSGFTGTFVWADPEFDIVYVFLSNRVYPSRSHSAISSLRVRQSVLQVLYDELGYRY
ncbi:serine hydrolase [Marinilabiliaceae bacterium ANBcel2]|nr:serine hydrolase [Marinilabiliaceae bacterium ANBcel2]